LSKLRVSGGDTTCGEALENVLLFGQPRSRTCGFKVKRNWHKDLGVRREINFRHFAVPKLPKGQLCDELRHQTCWILNREDGRSEGSCTQERDAWQQGFEIWNSRSSGISVEVAEKKDSYMHFTIFHVRGQTLKISDLSEAARTRKVGGPQICRWVCRSVWKQKVEKIDLFCFCRSCWKINELYYFLHIFMKMNVIFRKSVWKIGGEKWICVCLQKLLKNKHVTSSSVEVYEKEQDI